MSWWGGGDSRGGWWHGGSGWSNDPWGHSPGGSSSSWGSDAAAELVSALAEALRNTAAAAAAHPAPSEVAPDSQASKATTLTAPSVAPLPAVAGNPTTPAKAPPSVLPGKVPVVIVDHVPGNDGAGSNATGNKALQINNK